MATATKRGRGRPKGAKNKPKEGTQPKSDRAQKHIEDENGPINKPFQISEINDAFEEWRKQEWIASTAQDQADAAREEVQQLVDSSQDMIARHYNGSPYVAEDTEGNLFYLEITNKSRLSCRKVPKKELPAD